MDLRFKPEEEDFRKEVREFIEKEVPKRWKELHYTYWEEDDVDSVTRVIRNGSIYDLSYY